MNKNVTDQIQKRGSLIVIQGITPNIGASVISLGIAWNLAHRCEEHIRIAYVCLNLKSSKVHHYCGIDNPMFSLDRIRADLRANSLDVDRFRSLYHQFPAQPQLFVLFGNLLREQAEYYTADDISTLLLLCREAFDVTIVETGAYWDNAAVFTAMREADERLFVCTNRLGSFQEDYIRSSKPMLEALSINREDCSMIISQYCKGEGYGKGDVCKQTGMRVIAAVRKEEIVDSLVEQGRLVELYDNANRINSELDHIAKSLQHKWNLPVKRHDSAVQSEPPQRWFQKLLAFTGR